MTTIGKRKIYSLDTLPPKREKISNRVKNIEGEKFGRLTALFPTIEKSTDGGILWACKCDCGNNYILSSGSDLKRKRCHCCGSKEDYIFVQEKEIQKRYNELNGQIFNYLQVLNFSQSVNKRIYLNCKCLKCGSLVEVRKDSLLNGHTTSCGCIKSKGEETIKKFLDIKKISYLTEYKFDDCVDKNELRFDFAIFNESNNLLGLIEYQGRQHFINDEEGWNTKEHLEYTIKHDNLKKDYCKKKHISLFYIDYKDNIEEKLKEVLNELYS